MRTRTVDTEGPSHRRLLAGSCKLPWLRSVPCGHGRWPTPASACAACSHAPAAKLRPVEFRRRSPDSACESRPVRPPGLRRPAGRPVRAPPPGLPLRGGRGCSPSSFGHRPACPAPSRQGSSAAGPLHALAPPLGMLVAASIQHCGTFAVLDGPRLAASEVTFKSG
jgi:hypothetical protein